MDKFELLHRGLYELERRLIDGCRLKYQDGEWMLFDSKGECNDDSASPVLIHLVRKLGMTVLKGKKEG